MKRKNYVVIVVAVIMCLVLSACGEKEEQSGYTAAELLEASGEEDIIRCSKYLGGHSVPYYTVKDFINAVQEAAPDNIFSKEISSRYESLELDKKTDFEKDFFEMIPYAMCDGWGNVTTNKEEYGFNVSTEDFGNAWIVGYADEKADAERAIIVETTGYKWRNYPYVYLLAFDGEYNIMGIMEDTLTDVYRIDPASESGKVVNTAGSMGSYSDFCKHVRDIEASFNGAEYIMIPEERVDAMIEEYMDFYSLLKLYVDHQYFNYDPYTDTFNMQDERVKEMKLKESEPELGMTADEVLMGIWGEPDKKNIDEYEWGTEEQWVYEGRGYVYLENGIVTAIQHR